MVRRTKWCHGAVRRGADDLTTVVHSENMRELFSNQVPGQEECMTVLERDRRRMLVTALERELGATYVDDLTPGHTGATIMRFERPQDGCRLIAKCCLDDAGEALADIQGNILGYAAFRAIGAEALIPAEYASRTIAGFPVLTMQDLGEDLRTIAERVVLRGYVNLRDHLRSAIRATVRDDPEGERGRNGIATVVAAIQRYANPLAPFVGQERVGIFRQRIPQCPSARVALMLLDCTPDNIFVNELRCSIIDPWGQGTYHGHSAVSIGQFVTLARDIYRMGSATVGGEILVGFARTELSVMLACDAACSERALQLGAALQYICSAYVRRERDPDRAMQYVECARAAYDAALGGAS